MSTRRRRTQRIRTAVAAGSAAAFLALFSGLYAQMAAGNDPALAATTAAATEQVATTTTATDASTDTAAAMTPLTTRQS
jgi:hypothetical protein